MIAVAFAVEAVEIAAEAMVVDWYRVRRFDPYPNRFWVGFLLPEEKASSCLSPLSDYVSL